MSIPAAILEAKRASVGSPDIRTLAGRSDISLPLFIQHPKEPLVIPLDVEWVDRLMRWIDWLPQHWTGLIALVSLWGVAGPQGALLAAFGIAVVHGWLKAASKQSGVWYVKRFRPFVIAHIRWGCSREERDYRRSLCGVCTNRYQVGKRNFCKAMQSSCKCGHWLFSSLEWLTGLANWGCPQRYFVRETNESSWFIAQKMKGGNRNG